MSYLSFLSQDALCLPHSLIIFFQGSHLFCLFRSLFFVWLILQWAPEPFSVTNNECMWACSACSPFGANACPRSRTGVKNSSYYGTKVPASVSHRGSQSNQSRIKQTLWLLPSTACHLYVIRFLIYCAHKHYINIFLCEIICLCPLTTWLHDLFIQLCEWHHGP